MIRPLRIEYTDAWYHVMKGGRRDEIVFAEKNDYTLFVNLPKATAELWNLPIASYCLMPNHCKTRLVGLSMGGMIAFQLDCRHPSLSVAW